MKNLLKKFEETDVKFFVMKSYITAAFESDRKKPEYNIFFIKPNSIPDAYYLGYRDLKIRKMNRKEIEHFKRNIDNYNIKLKNEDGTVYNLKDRDFDKEHCTKFRQYSLFL